MYCRGRPIVSEQVACSGRQHLQSQIGQEAADAPRLPSEKAEKGDAARSISHRAPRTRVHPLVRRSGHRTSFQAPGRQNALRRKGHTCHRCSPSCDSPCSLRRQKRSRQRNITPTQQNLTKGWTGTMFIQELNKVAGQLFSTTREALRRATSTAIPMACAVGA